MLPSGIVNDDIIMLHYRLTKRDELSFLRVLAFPKASRAGFA